MRKVDLVLVGAGHVNLAVLADWARFGVPAGLTAALVTPQAFFTYSGMVPGWVAGEYLLGEGRIDLVRLADKAGAMLLLDHCTAIEPDLRICTLASGEGLAFRWAALDTGGVGRGAQVLGNDPRLIDVRPIAEFMAGLARWREENRSGAERLAVVGGGAGGVELAFGLRNMVGLAAPCEVTLVTGSGGLLPGFAGRMRHLAARELAREGIAVREADASIIGGALHAGACSLEPLDLIVAATGSAAPRWPGEGGLACDPSGFVAVDSHQRSLSHPHILAGGDLAASTNPRVVRSGVHAVRAGPVVAANLRALTKGEEPHARYRPRPASLYLLNTGQGAALASYGAWAAHGRWAHWLKQRIDTRWIAAYAKLADA